MTVTVKLDAELEELLRRRAAATGRTTSDVIRDALQAWLVTGDAPQPPSAHALGADLFGRFRGAADLATRRKAVAAEAWADKHAARR
jgi:plasmid stability protein